MIKKITAIDFGSTNSQMGRKYVDSETGKPIKNGWHEDDLLLNLVKDSGYTNFPTVVLQDFAEGKMYYSREAEEHARTTYQGEIKLYREFKKELFVNADGRNEEKYKEACEKTRELLRRFREIEQNMASAIKYEEEETYITVPNRSSQGDKEVMEQLAKEAGWKNVTIKEEADAALRYAVYKPKSELMAQIENITTLQKIHVLLIDIGGSTTDIIHATVSPDGNGGYYMDLLGQWPGKGESDTLGGIDLDIAVKNLMQKEEYILKDQSDALCGKIGYIDFRKFKEDWSKYASRNDVITNYGPLKDYSEAQGATRRERIFSKKDYEDPNEKKLGKKELDALARDYILKMQDAIRSVLKQDNIKESDIDFVITAGGGSGLCCIDDMIFGSFDIQNNPAPLEFEKIQKNPRMYIHGYKNPSSMCCLGCLMEEKEINCRQHTSGSFKCQVEAYTVMASRYDSETHNKMRPGHLVDVPDYAKKVYISDMEVIVRDKEMLPATYTMTCNDKFTRYSGEKLLFRVTIYREDPATQESTIELSWLYLMSRTLGRTIIDEWNEWVHGYKTDEVGFNLKLDFTMEEDKKLKIVPAISSSAFSGDSNYNISRVI